MHFFPMEPSPDTDQVLPCVTEPSSHQLPITEEHSDEEEDELSVDDYETECKAPRERSKRAPEWDFFQDVGPWKTIHKRMTKAGAKNYPFRFRSAFCCHFLASARAKNHCAEPKPIRSKIETMANHIVACPSITYETKSIYKGDRNGHFYKQKIKGGVPGPEEEKRGKCELDRYISYGLTTSRKRAVYDTL